MTLDDDEKGQHTVPTPGGNQQLTIVSEAGLYSLILRSRKPEANNDGSPMRERQRLAVLPTIRRTGGTPQRFSNDFNMIL